MDLDTLKTGQKYKELKDSHVIFICLDDIFTNELPVYTFEYICKEDGKTKLNDRALKYFFIAKNCAKMIEDNEVRSFFNFLITNKASNEYTSNLDEYVIDAKHNMQWRFQYMTWERQQTYAMDKGIEIGKEEKAIESAKNFLKENIPIETIVRCIGLPLETVQELAEEIKK